MRQRNWPETKRTCKRPYELCKRRTARMSYDFRDYNSLQAGSPSSQSERARTALEAHSGRAWSTLGACSKRVESTLKARGSVLGARGKHTESTLKARARSTSERARTALDARSERAWSTLGACSECAWSALKARPRSHARSTLKACLKRAESTRSNPLGAWLHVAQGAVVTR